MNSFLSSLRPNKRRVLFATSAFVAAAFTAVLVHGAGQDSKPAINLNLDKQEVNRGTLESASFAKVAKKVAPSVVKIIVETKSRVIQNPEEMGIPDPIFRHFFGNRMPQLRSQPQSGLGSGVIISSDGYIVTNNHVVEHADILSVSLDDGRKLKAKIVGRDADSDIAVIKVEAKDLPAITFAESAKTEVGDRVLAIGNPFGIGETVTSGIISAKGRKLGLGLAYEDFIQTDAAINPGNSGGALVDVEGRLIGINTAIYSRSGGFQGIGLAVPSDMVRTVSDSLVKNGKVIRGYLGVHIQNVDAALSESFGAKDNNGALINDVTADSPAEKAGLKEGDIITEVNGSPVTDGTKLAMVISSISPGTEVSLKVLRDGKYETIKATTGTLPTVRGNGELGGPEVGKSDDQGVLEGVAVSDLDRAAREEMNIPPRVKGALISRVAEDSASARAGLQAGDVILEINGKPVLNAEDAVKLSQSAASKKTRLKVWSHGQTVFTVVDETDSKTP